MLASSMYTLYDEWLKGPYSLLSWMCISNQCQQTWGLLRQEQILDMSNLEQILNNSTYVIIQKRNVNIMEQEINNFELQECVLLIINVFVRNTLSDLLSKLYCLTSLMIIIVNEIDMVIGRYYVANRKPQSWKQLFDAQLKNYSEFIYF